MLTLSVLRTAAPLDAAHRRDVNVWRDNRGEICARLAVDGAVHWIDWPGLGRFAFTLDQHSVRVWPEPTVEEATLRDFFDRRLQPLILQALGYQALHASASFIADGAVAFCGRSGAGKSTLAAALQQSGCPQIADDALTLRVTDSGTFACPLPFRSDLRPSAFAHLGQPAFPQPAPPLSACRLRLVVLLAQDPNAKETPIARPILGPERFRLLLTHAHAFDPTGDAERLARDYLTVAHAVPTVELRYRPDFSYLPDLVAAVMRLAADPAGTVAVSSGGCERFT